MKYVRLSYNLRKKFEFFMLKMYVIWIYSRQSLDLGLLLFFNCRWLIEMFLIFKTPF